MDTFKQTFNSLGWKNYLRLTATLLVPMLMISAILLLVPSTLSATVLLLPLVIPIFANTSQKIWYCTVGRNDKDINPFNYSRYYRNIGLNGYMGMGSVVVIAVIISNFLLLILFANAFEPTWSAFGYGELASQYHNIEDADAALNFVEMYKQEMTGPVVLLSSCSLFVGLLISIINLSNSSQGYVVFQRLMPDADLNFYGAQSRKIGKTLLSPQIGFMLKSNWFLYVLYFSILTISYGGFTVLFSFIEVSHPELTAGLPAMFSILLTTPILTLLLASKVITADKMMSLISSQMEEGDINYLNTLLKDPAYKRSEFNRGQKLFFGHQSEKAAYDDMVDKPLYDATEQEDDIQIFDAEVSESDETPTDKETKDSPSYGFFDFSSDDDDTKN